jgi:hypothetical protein
MKNVKRALGKFQFASRTVKKVVPKLCVLFHHLADLGQWYLGGRLEVIT